MLENDVVMQVKTWLERQGHTVERFSLGTQRGDDIAATLRDGSLLFVECKGSTSRSGGRLDSWHCAAMATFGALKDTEEKRPRHRHAIAIPDDPAYRETLDGLSAFFARQQIALLWVKDDGSVRVAGARHEGLED